MQPLLNTRNTLPEEPRELPALADAITALGAKLQAAGWPLGDLAPFLAEVRAADAQWSREADELAADADPVEATRLRERLAKVQGAARAGAHQGEMVRLIERQLELQERASERRRVVLARRDRLREGCALLWRQLRSLRAEHAHREDSGEITGRIRALCADVSNDISAEHETLRLVTPAKD